MTAHEYARTLYNAAQPVAPIVQPATYEPHCVIAWEEQMRAMDDHALKGIDDIICAEE